MRERYAILIEGSVQGVGFRPYVFRLASRHRLAGSVCNGPSGVRIEVEGEEDSIAAFCNDLRSGGPPLSRIDRLSVESSPVRDEREFRIVDSITEPGTAVPIPPDTATCPACLAELFDPADRRFGYPFINCTDCGPRLTIVESLPYDRARTTMAGFPMCQSCRAEYEDPASRRFHAEPIACPDCGPRAALLDRAGGPLDGDPVARAAELLKAGRIVAVKGLGGYHLACDARSDEAVGRLRRRKRRAWKPFAIMLRDSAEARRLCRIGPAEEKLLTDGRAPIVLLDRRPDAAVSGAVAPGQRQLGVMLAYAPIHHLLMARMDGPLVMTSGNVSGGPIAHRDQDALSRLFGIADAFLTHDRPIATRCDDSVARVVAGRPSLFRRSRGYAPEVLPLPVGAAAPILAMGGDLKNVLALARGREALLSHHIGDLQHLDTYLALGEAISHYTRLAGVRPQVVAHDPHPAYLSTRMALEMREVEPVGVQHHHAHLAACLAEHGTEGPAIGVVFDGTGYGEDGAIWGGEFLIGGLRGVRRAAHLAYVPLPGGDAAVREPWRAAAAHLLSAYPSDAPKAAPEFVERIGGKRWNAVAGMVRANRWAVRTSSVGRLFDAVTALTGGRDRVEYEGQAAIELEAIATPGRRSYPVELDWGGTCGLWRPEPIIRGVVEDLRRGRSPSAIAGAFHETVADAIRTVCGRLRDETGLGLVALSGGVFQNATLLRSAAAGLRSDGFTVLMHGLVPTNDAGLSFGQAAVCAARTAGRM